MSQPVLQGDSPAREQDSPAQPGNGDGGSVLWRFGGLEPPSSDHQPPPGPHCGPSAALAKRGISPSHPPLLGRDPHSPLVLAGDTGGGNSFGSSSTEEDEEEPDFARSSHDAGQVGGGLGGL